MSQRRQHETQTKERGLAPAGQIGHNAGWSGWSSGVCIILRCADIFSMGPPAGPHGSCLVTGNGPLSRLRQPPRPTKKINAGHYRMILHIAAETFAPQDMARSVE